jgi:GAF domain-containing protein
MSEISHEEKVVETFAALAETLTRNYDVVELMQTLVESCADLLEVSAAGIMLADADGELDVVASTSEAIRLVEVMQLGAEAGPCIDSFRTGTVVSVPEIEQSPDDWAEFKAGALAQGFASAYAIPLKVRETTIGTLNLLRGAVGQLERADILTARALADVATIGIFHERSLQESNIIRDQLSQALQSRVVIEQAKGVLAHTHNANMDEAFTRLRTYARSNGLKLSAVATDVVNHRLSI